VALAPSSLQSRALHAMAPRSRSSPSNIRDLG
jgi:hypothetical protein